MNHCQYTNVQLHVGSTKYLRQMSKVTDGMVILTRTWFQIQFLFIVIVASIQTECVQNFLPKPSLVFSVQL